MSEQNVIDYGQYGGSVGPPPQAGFVAVPSARKTWEVELATNQEDFDGTIETVTADDVMYGSGVIEFITNGRVTHLFNLDSVVAVRTVDS